MKVENYCKCGAAFEGVVPISHAFEIAEVEQFFWSMHQGPGHGSIGRLAWRQAAIARGDYIVGEDDPPWLEPIQDPVPAEEE